MIRPKFLNVKTDQMMISYCCVSLLIMLIHVVNVFALFFDYTVKIIISFALFAFFFCMIPLDLYEFVKKLLFDDKA